MWCHRWDNRKAESRLSFSTWHAAHQVVFQRQPWGGWGPKGAPTELVTREYRWIMLGCIWKWEGRLQRASSWGTLGRRVPRRVPAMTGFYLFIYFRCGRLWWKLTKRWRVDHEEPTTDWLKPSWKRNTPRVTWIFASVALENIRVAKPKWSTNTSLPPGWWSAPAGRKRKKSWENWLNYDRSCKCLFDILWKLTELW